jgi:flagellar L-ring protein precursor FlgH
MVYRKGFGILWWGVFLLSGCAGAPFKEEPQVPVVQPLSQQGLPNTSLERTDPAARGGLWQEHRSRGLFRDLRAYRVGDLVTVNIVETSKATKKAKTKTARQSSVDAGISNLLGYESRLPFPSEFSNEAMFKASMKNGFDGSGETSRDETMTASITARVLEVAPNGNLLIRGSRQIKVNNENQYITLTGLIRPVDISPDNTVLSSFVADAHIEYAGRGAVSDKQRPGWLMRAVDFVWPF